MAADTPIHHAATVIMLRDRDAGGVELLMVKRHSRSSFMPSVYVYPGGRLDDEDTTAQTAARCRGVRADEALARMLPTAPRGEEDAPLKQAEALGLYVAAIREAFEESGLLLATGPSGDAVSFEDPAIKARFEVHRKALQRGELSMTAMARAEGLRFELDALRYVAHWITPDFEKRRFNTRFFLARAPEGQQPVHDNQEVVDAVWLSPEEALAGADAGRMMLAPPTARTLERMQGFERVEALMSALSAQPVVSILPRFEAIDGETTLLMPGDARWPSPVKVPGHTRMQMKDKRWRSVPDPHQSG